MSDQNKTALVTGASSGLGYDFCHLLAGEGYDLVVVARREDRLKELADSIKEKYGRMVNIFAMDLSVDNAAKKLYQSINERDLKINMLINNAGVGRYGIFHEMDGHENEDMIKLNILSLTSLTRLFVNDMVKAGNGRVLNVASLAAFQPAGPKFAVYFASKAYVLSFTRSLRIELKNTGVTVTALCPGPTKTEFGEDDQVQSTRLFNLLPGTSSQQVVEAGYKALMKNKATVVPGILNKFLAIGGELPPRIIAVQINKFLLG